MAERAHPEDRGFKDKFFGLIKNKYKENLYKRYFFCNKFIVDKKILDIPCGMGWGTSLLKGYKKCIGVDISLEAVKEAKIKYKTNILDFKQGNMLCLDFDDNSFDVIICLEGFEHVTFLEGQKFLHEAKRILKKGGLLIVSTPLLVKNKYHSGNKYHLCEYKEKELFEVLVDKSFDLQHKEYFNTAENSQIIIVVAKNEKN
jgi:ubiquinone/menaquinone biosynthesis C-methylase UbiE